MVASVHADGLSLCLSIRAGFERRLLVLVPSRRPARIRPLELPEYSSK